MPVHLPVYVGAEGIASIGYTLDNAGDNISSKIPTFVNLPTWIWFGK